ncbi:MAG: hypothetical protein H3Z54_02440 [archaeon]|nr:hypothetical protein [archaeon]MCP8315695.1 hypothetical protein [archaeon]
MKRRHLEKMEEIIDKSAICKFCQKKDSCKIAENSIIFCTEFKKGRTSIERFVDFYECKQGHRFGVDNIGEELRKNSIPCPVCLNPAFFREMVRFKI